MCTLYTRAATLSTLLPCTYTCVCIVFFTSRRPVTFAIYLYMRESESSVVCIDI